MGILKKPKVKGARSSSVNMMPETEPLSMLPYQPVNTQKSVSRPGKKVDTMKERNKVAAPTSNPASAPPHLQRTAHPVRKRKFQIGGTIPRPLIQAPQYNGPIREPQLSNSELNTRVQKWRQSPEWYSQASGKTEVTDSPIDMVLLGGAANYAGKGAGFLSKFLDKKALQVMDNTVAKNFGKYDDMWESVSGLVSPILKTARYGIPLSYAASKVTNFLENK